MSLVDRKGLEGAVADLAVCEEEEIESGGVTLCILVGIVGGDLI